MKNLLLTNQTGAALYEKYAKRLPIIDFHCHLQPSEIQADKPFEDLGEIWLAHDHYKWRCMRSFGIDESLITGKETSFQQKFMAFAEIMPMLAGNPVYAWCQLELARYFGIDQPLGPNTAQTIYDQTRAMIQDQRMSPRYFIEQSGVEYIATTDDPVDDLCHHEAIAKDGKMKALVAPAMRPDRAMNIGGQGFAEYIAKLAAVSGVQIDSFEALIAALDVRMAFFHAHGARVTDHGMDNMDYAAATNAELDANLKKALGGGALSALESNQYKSAFLLAMAGLCKKHGMVMQMHFGALRNVNSGMLSRLGPDSGFDACDEPMSVRAIAALLDEMDRRGAMPRVMLYPINAAQFEPFAILAAAFCGSGMKARVSLGAPWWFNDQPHGIKRQFEAAGQLYPLALSTGMVTDSRSFLSYPRHELYRRVLCNYLGELVERGEYVSGDPALGAIIEAVCYGNAKAYLAL